MLFDAEDDIQYLINSGLAPNAGAPQEEEAVEPDEALDDKLRKGIKKNKVPLSYCVPVQQRSTRVVLLGGYILYEVKGRIVRSSQECSP